MSQNTTINGTINTVNSVITTEVNAVAVSGRDGLRDSLRLDSKHSHLGKPLCQASAAPLAARSAYPACSRPESWQEQSPSMQGSSSLAFAGLETPAVVWASLIVSSRAISV